MEFPIAELLSLEESEQWILEHFHPQGLRCPWCQSSVERANLFRMTRKSKLKVYRCRDCQHIYNLYTNTVLQQHHLTPQQAVLLLRGILKGETTNELAAELELNYLTVLSLRREIQQNAEHLQPETPVPDLEAESDELFQNAGEKRSKVRQSASPSPSARQQTTRPRHVRQ
jgi:transposase-like protein